jgi:hypothetical protein
MTMSLLNSMANHPVFAGIPRGTVARFGERAQLRHFPTGLRIFAEGAPANRFWLIGDGRVGLDLHTPGRGTLTVETLGGGALLGWSWLCPPYRWRVRRRRGATDVRGRARRRGRACAVRRRSGRRVPARRPGPNGRRGPALLHQGPPPRRLRSPGAALIIAARAALPEDGRGPPARWISAWTCSTSGVPSSARSSNASCQCGTAASGRFTARPRRMSMRAIPSRWPVLRWLASARSA